MENDCTRSGVERIGLKGNAVMSHANWRLRLKLKLRSIEMRLNLASLPTASGHVTCQSRGESPGCFPIRKGRYTLGQVLTLHRLIRLDEAYKQATW